MSYSSEVLADSPTHFWKLWDASGTAAVDSSGNSRDGTYVNTPTLHATSPLDVDASAFAVTLNGTTQYISRADEASLRPVNFCAEIIVKVNGGAGVFRAAVTTRSEVGTTGWLLYITDTNKFQLRVTDTVLGALTLSSDAATSVGSTYHVVVTNDGGTFKMYVNGALQAQTVSAANWVGVNTQGLRIGSRLDSNFFAPVTVQHFAHYSSALSATRVLAHYNAATTIAPATGSGSTTIGAVPSLTTQTIIDSRATSFALVPNSSGNIIASGGITVGLTPAVSNQTLKDAGVANLILTPSVLSTALVISQAQESDSALAARPVKTTAVGQALETDGAGTIQGPVVVPVNQAQETDSTLSLIGTGRSFSVSQATETDIAQAVKHLRLENVTQPTVTDTGQPVTPSKTVRPTQATETNLAQPATVVRIVHVGQALEADLAQPVTHRRTFHVGQVIEGDTSQAVISVRTFHVGAATETDQAQAAQHARTRHVGQALETDAPLPFPKFIDVGQALEIDLGQTATVRRGFNVGRAIESDVAGAFEFTRGHTYRVRIGQDFQYSRHANPKKTDHEGIVKRVRIAYESVYSHPVNER